MTSETLFSVSLGLMVKHEQITGEGGNSILATEPLQEDREHRLNAAISLATLAYNMKVNEMDAALKLRALEMQAGLGQAPPSGDLGLAN